MGKKHAFFSIAITGLLLSTTALQSCKPEHTTADDNEVITSLSVIATDSATGEIKTFSFRDLDGTGSNAPIQFDTIRLAANTTYHVKLLLLDETKSPIDTISTEIAEKADEHLFFFAPTPTNLVTVTTTDFDSHNLPIGLLSTWYTGNSESGNITISLRHQPGVKNGTYEPGDTDVEVAFVMEIQ